MPAADEWNSTRLSARHSVERGWVRGGQQPAVTENSQLGDGSCDHPCNRQAHPNITDVVYARAREKAVPMPFR